MIHFKFIHRFYFTPRKRCQLQLCSTPICPLCNKKQLGTYLHTMWQCSDVEFFWSQVAFRMGDIIGTSIPCNPIILLLNDDSQLLLNFSQRRLLFLGLTAAKKMLIQRWKPAHSFHISQWTALLYDILTLELSIAHLNAVAVRAM